MSTSSSTTPSRTSIITLLPPSSLSLPLSSSSSPPPSTVSVVTSTTTFFTTVIVTVYPTASSVATLSSSSSVQVSGTLLPVPSGSSSIFTRNRGILAGLIVGVLFASASICIYAWFTWKRHRVRQLEAALNEKPAGVDLPVPGVTSPVRSILDDDDRSFYGVGTALSRGNTVGERQYRRSSIGHDGNLVIYPGADGVIDTRLHSSPFVPEENPYGYIGPSAASSNGHYAASSHSHTSAPPSSHGHGAFSNGQPHSLRAQSPPSAWPVDGRVTPTAWQAVNMGTLGSRAASSASSVESMMGMFVQVSDPEIGSNLGYNPGLPPMYPVAPSDSYQPYSPTLTSQPVILQPPPAAVPNQPSSLLRPPSVSPINFLAPSPPFNPNVYLHPPTPRASPALSERSISWGREDLLDHPGDVSGAAGSLHSLRDELDYTRRIRGQIINHMGDSASVNSNERERGDNATQ